MPRKTKSAKSLFILDGLRTPVGHPYMGLRDFSAAQLAALVIKEMVRRDKLKAKEIGGVILGNTVSAGTGQNLARQAAVAAGLPAQVPALTVNNVCGAGLQAVVSAAQAILAGDAQIMIAGGAESASQAPYFVARQEAENYEKKEPDLHPIDCIANDGLMCPITGKRMGELIEDLVYKFKISREEQDDYAFESHRKACAAQETDKFKHEIVTVKTKKKTVIKDEHPRKKLDRSWLNKLPPVFWTGGTVTAGNASLSCDGAAAVVLADGAYVKEHRLKPKARLAGYASVAIDPERTFEATIEAIRMCLKKTGLALGDIDLFELSEAFAAQIILARKQLKIPAQKINVFGGDIAFGHPLGAAGARILVTLLNALRDGRKRRGLACVAYGGGGAVAAIVERVK